MADMIEVQKYGQYLKGLQEGMPEAFFHLEAVFKYEAFELCRKENSRDYLVPYMMNDALEYYFVLKDVRMTGEYQPEDAIVMARIAQEDDRYILVIRQESGNTVTLIFQNLEEHAQCYQYHRIGHFWRKGQEHWRQLVYMIGTAHDKYEYFGERFCSAKEQELIALMHFAPFRYWSPVGESLDAHYPEQKEGLYRMEELAREAEDYGFLKLLKWYRYLPAAPVKKLLIHQMLSPKRQRLYELIWKLVQEASMEYPERQYEESLNKKIHMERERVDKELKKLGFGGNYPHYSADRTWITVAEEHTFTVPELDWEDFKFRIRFMISQIADFDSDNKESDQMLNAGFFRGKGRRAEIVEASSEEISTCLKRSTKIR